MHQSLNDPPRDPPPIRRRKTLKVRAGERRLEEDALAAEEPLEIRLGGRRFTLTMRTPGHDEELVRGFLFGEGFIERASEIGEIRRVRGRRGVPEENAIDVILEVPAAGLRERLRRNFMTASSCGVCGKTSIEAIRRRIKGIRGAAEIAASVLLKMPVAMRAAQPTFARTGGLHAAALFDLEGRLLVLREDVGRHNAMDKVIGCALANRELPLSRRALMVSGRLSFELVQKAAAAGAPIVAAVSAPSSLAVELAEEAGMTLVGFVRDAGFNIYTHPHRVTV